MVTSDPAFNIILTFVIRSNLNAPIDDMLVKLDLTKVSLRANYLVLRQGFPFNFKG